MPDREKLIELLWEYDQMRMMRMSIEECADRLVPKGVTVQEWISVKDRLPEDNGKLQAFLVCRNQPSSTSGKVLIETEFFTNDFSGNNNVTHWMPKPQPPKGE